jgi:hypothetical protein
MRHKNFLAKPLDIECTVVSNMSENDRLAILDILTSEPQISLHYCIC